MHQLTSRPSLRTVVNLVWSIYCTCSVANNRASVGKDNSPNRKPTYPTDLTVPLEPRSPNCTAQRPKKSI
jgi:hypothetical protein